MTIDEIKVRLMNLMKPIRINLMDIEVEVGQEEQYPYLKPIFEALEGAIECLDELQWYREQDLIRREEVPVMRLCMAINTNHFDDATRILNGIPKAEPSKMRDPNVEEIKNTNDYLKTISKPTGVHFEADRSIVVHKKEDWDRFQADINRLE